MRLPYLYNQQILQKMKPSMRYQEGENFEDWQRRSRQKLIELLGLPLEPCEANYQVISEKDSSDHRRIYFQFQSEPGYEVPCCLCIPKNLKSAVPVVICLQGHSTGMHISLGEVKYPQDRESIESGDRDFALQAIKMGYCAITVEQRCFGECGGTENGPACRDSSLIALLAGRTTIGERVWDVEKLIDLIETGIFPEIDPQRICCMGNSGGGTTAFFASCVDTRIGFSMPSCYVCTFYDSIVLRRHCECNYIPQICRYFDMGDLGGLIAPRPLVVVAGEKDPIFPKNGVEITFRQIQSLYNAANASACCHLVIGPEGHRFYADLAWPVMNPYLQS
ncbi:MAG: alpha/beta hydrolase family protein [Candidatus Merdivicinus sp.]|jgi:hypothetical protein